MANSLTVIEYKELLEIYEGNSGVVIRESVRSILYALKNESWSDTKRHINILKQAQASVGEQFLIHFKEGIQSHNRICDKIGWEAHKVDENISFEDLIEKCNEGNESW